MPSAVPTNGLDPTGNMLTLFNEVDAIATSVRDLEKHMLGDRVDERSPDKSYRCMQMSSYHMLRLPDDAMVKAGIMCPNDQRTCTNFWDAFGVEIDKLDRIALLTMVYSQLLYGTHESAQVQCFEVEEFDGTKAEPSKLGMGNEYITLVRQANVLSRVLSGQTKKAVFKCLHNSHAYFTCDLAMYKSKNGSQFLCIGVAVEDKRKWDAFTETHADVSAGAKKS